MKNKFYLAAALLCAPLSARAQISVTAANTVYTQDFNTLASDSSVSVNEYTTTPWVQNSTLPGWYLMTVTGDPNAVSTYRSKDGNAKTGSFWSYGAAGTTDRALGSWIKNGDSYYDVTTDYLAQGPLDVGYIVVALKNNSGGPLAGATLSYTGEQWRESATASNNTIRVDYGFGDTYDTVTWTPAGDAFNFTTLVNGTTLAVNGNAAGFRTTGIGGTFTGEWTAGKTLWIRWVEINDGGVDQGWAIDDVSITANGMGGSAPTITQQPAAQSVTLGGSAAFSVTATDATGYQWSKDNVAIDGATSATLSLSNIQASDAGSYTVLVTNDGGSVSSDPAVLTVTIPAPVITQQPATQNVDVAANVTFTVTATGSSLTYQWSKDGVAIDGATSATLTLTNVQASDGGNYTVTITNSGGSVSSTAAMLTVIAPAGFPQITGQPASQTVLAGAPLSLAVTATGSDLSYQWSKNGTVIDGATSPTLVISSATDTDAGSYTVAVTNSAGTAMSKPAVIVIASGNYTGSYFGTFGSGGGHWALVVRADKTATYLAYLPDRHSILVVDLTVDPLGHFSVTGTELVASANAERSALGTTRSAASAGDFTLTGQISGDSVSGQLDGFAVTFTGAADPGGSAPAGLYTAQALGSASGTAYAIVGSSGQTVIVTTLGSAVDGASGTVDAGGQFTAATGNGGQLALALSAQSLAATLTPAGSSPVTFSGLPETVGSTSHLVNISTRAFGGTGNSVAIGGFVITGTSKLVLIRAVGPTLASLGLAASEVMSDPVVEVHQGSDIVATNDNQADNPNAAQIATVSAQIGATPLAADDTHSSALLLTLPHGVYSFVAHDKNNASGVVLAEIYDADTANTASSLVNISSRVFCATGNKVAIGGYVVTGNAPKRLLIRAVGPTLASLGLGASEVMPDPVLEVHQGNDIVAANDNQADNPDPAAVSNASSRVGATPLAASDTKSAASLVTLPPGVYSFVVHDKTSSSGVVLLEVYDAD